MRAARKIRDPDRFAREKAASSGCVNALFRTCCIRIPVYSYLSGHCSLPKSEVYRGGEGSGTLVYTASTKSGRRRPWTGCRRDASPSAIKRQTVHCEAPKEHGIAKRARHKSATKNKTPEHPLISALRLPSTPRPHSGNTSAPCKKTRISWQSGQITTDCPLGSTHSTARNSPSSSAVPSPA